MKKAEHSDQWWLLNILYHDSNPAWLNLKKWLYFCLFINPHSSTETSHVDCWQWNPLKSNINIKYKSIYLFRFLAWNLYFQLIPGYKKMWSQIRWVQKQTNKQIKYREYELNFQSQFTGPFGKSVELIEKIILALKDEDDILKSMPILPVLSDILFRSSSRTEYILKLIQDVSFGIRIKMCQPYVERLIQFCVKTLSDGTIEVSMFWCNKEN